MSTPLVVCEAVSRTYGRGRLAVVAVHDVSGAVFAGDRIAVIGPSGSGKSTLLHLMVGLDNPTSGRVAWPAWPAGPFRDPSKAGTVFQGPSLMPALTAVENAALPLLLRGVGHDEATVAAAQALVLLGIEDLADKTPDEMSGGQAQRVAVARVVASRPELIVADEPTGRLDRVASARVVDVLHQAATHLGAALVIATHDPAVAARLGATWRMRDGELTVAA